jgi:hypothetical protein
VPSARRRPRAAGAAAVVDFTPHQWQSDAIAAYHELGGVFVGADPGTGKTYVAARIAAACARPLLLTPAPRQAVVQLREYGVDAYLAADRKRHPQSGHVAVATYAWLTRAENAAFFETYRPSDVLMDEYHMVRGLGHSARVRLERYLVARPEVRVGVFTGSPMSGRLHDFAYGLTWALRSRVKHLVPQLRAGLDALDDHLAKSPSAREDFHRRLAATPGVWLDVAAGQYPGKIVFELLRPPGGPVARLGDTWETPSGMLIASAAHAAEVDRQLAWGFYLDAEPRPSERYLEARRRWGGIVRRAILQGLADTEVQVRELEPDAYARWVWEAAREGELAPSRARWLPEAERVLRWVDQQVARSPSPPLVWAEHRALQDAVARGLDVPVHREGCRAWDGGLPTDHEQTAVLSIDACYQSYNLQSNRSYNLVLEPSSDPEVLKQLIGRTARQGQPEPEVHVGLVLNGPAAERALRTAHARAILVKETTGKNNPILQLNPKDFEV